LTTDAKTERPLMPIRQPDASTAIYRDLAVVTEGARVVPTKPVPSLREIQKEVDDLKAHLDHIIGQLKALSTSLNAALNG
jgi:hypothetical protein